MLNDALARLTIDQLKSLMRWLPDTSPTGKKDLLIGQILRSLDDDGLRTLWERLDDIQRMAVAEAAYAPDGLFDGKRFRAKYGRLPDFTVMEDGRRSYYGRPTASGLFLYYEAGYYCLPFDLRERLQSFVREPLPVRLSPVETLPEKAGEKWLTVRCNEHDATIDLLVLLRLTDQGKVQVSDKTSLPSTATLRTLTDQLAGGDFYVPPRKQRQRAGRDWPDQGVLVAAAAPGSRVGTTKWQQTRSERHGPKSTGVRPGQGIEGNLEQVAEVQSL